LENGYVLQEAVLQVAKEFRTRLVPDDRQLLTTLWEQRNVHLILWNGKDVRMWHWPADVRGALVRPMSLPPPRCNDMTPVARLYLQSFGHDDPDGGLVVSTENRYMQATACGQCGTHKNLEYRDVGTQYHVPTTSRKRSASRGGDDVEARCLCHWL
jgi:hypothetical protein